MIKLLHTRFAKAAARMLVLVIAFTSALPASHAEELPIDVLFEGLRDGIRAACVAAKTARDIDTAKGGDLSNDQVELCDCYLGELDAAAERHRLDSLKSKEEMRMVLKEAKIKCDARQARTAIKRRCLGDKNPGLGATNLQTYCECIDKGTSNLKDSEISEEIQLARADLDRRARDRMAGKPSPQPRIGRLDSITASCKQLPP